MKKFILTTFLLLSFHVNLFAQAKVEGIGPFKINSSLALLDSIIKVENMKIEVDDFVALIKKGDHERAMKAYEFSLDKKTRIRTVLFDSTDKYGPLEPDMFCHGVKLFILNKWMISDLEIRNIKLYYYNDQLFKVHSDFSYDLGEAMKAKYGKSTLDVKRNQIICSDKTTGLKEEFEEATFYETWNSSENIKAQSVTMSYYDNKCKKQALSFVAIEWIDTQLIVTTLAKSGKAEYERIFIEKKAKKYSEL